MPEEQQELLLLLSISGWGEAGRKEGDLTQQNPHAPVSVSHSHRWKVVKIYSVAIMEP